MQKISKERGKIKRAKIVLKRGLFPVFL